MSTPGRRTRATPSRHLDPARILDYLEGRAAAAAARALEEHLATPCAACRERVREAGLLLELMRSDRIPEVPAATRARALEAFAVRPVAAPAGRLAARLARLVFDSLAQPLPAAARRALGEARRLRFALGDGSIELEIEREERDAVALRGAVDLDEAALHRIEVRAGGERLVAWPDAGGRFALERVPAGRLWLTIAGPAGRFRVPPFET
jgi:hypothetical protein